MESPAINEAIFHDPDLDEVEDADPYFGPNDETDDDENDRIVREIKANVKKAKDHLNDWYVEARSNFDYFAGNQWTQEDIQKLNNERRPAITFNRIPRSINAVAGLEIENRQEVIYTARQTGDAIASEILTGAADYVRNNCDAEDEESQAFKESLICGMGWTETRIDYEVEADGKIIIDRVDPLEMVWDTTSKKRNLDDAMWIAREKLYTKKQFKALWPDVDVNLMQGAQDPKGMQPHDATLAPWYRNDQSSKDQRQKDTVRVTQYQKWIRVEFYRVQDETGDILELDKAEFKNRKKMIEFMGYPYVKQYRRVYKQYFVAGETMLEKGDCPVNMFTLRCITGMHDHMRNYWFGMVTLMKDPQQWANKWLSQTLHIFNSNAKGGYLAESGVFKDPRQAERTLAQNTVTYTAEDAIAEGRIIPKVAPPFPQGLDGMLQYAVSSVSELVGVNLETLGTANREQSGVLEAERKRTTVTIVADFFDALRRYRKEQARVLSDFIISYIADGRLVRIAGPGLGKYVPLVANELDFAYDIIVDDTPTSPHQQERVFAMIMQILPSLLQANIPVPPEVIEYSPFPAPLKRDWMALINKPPEPNPMEEQKEQLRLQLAILEAKTKEQDIQNAKADEFKTKTDSVLNMAKVEHERALAEHDAQLARKDDLRKDMEISLKIVKELTDDNRGAR